LPHVGRGIEDDGLELGEVDLAFREDALVGAHVDDLSHEDAVSPTHNLAFEGEGILVDDGGVHVRPVLVIVLKTPLTATAGRRSIFNSFCFSWVVACRMASVLFLPPRRPEVIGNSWENGDA